MEKQHINTKDNIEFVQIISELINNPKVQEMKKYRQHYNTSCFEHCLEVSYISYIICKKLGLDYTSAARAGLLHDLFLYDWRHSRKKLNLNGWHAFIHPKIALENAEKLFDINEKERDIIKKHMWPVTLLDVPKYRETFVITLVDKYSALVSSKNYYNKVVINNKSFRYAYIFLAIYIFNI